MDTAMTRFAGDVVKSVMLSKPAQLPAHAFEAVSISQYSTRRTVLLVTLTVLALYLCAFGFVLWSRTESAERVEFTSPASPFESRVPFRPTVPAFRLAESKVHTEGDVLQRYPSGQGVERDDAALGATTSDPKRLAIDDLYISVKTTKRFHRNRVDVILKTWFALARDQTYFFTDDEDPEFSRKTYNHLINTRCPPSHNRKALCCKMGAEFDHYLQSRKKWWCHFDDDNYVNVPQLLHSLQGYDHRQEWYLGKTSIKDPLETRTRGKNPESVSFWFATGGAGFCVSQALALRMKSLASGGRFSDIGESIRLPDDVTMGYVVEVLLGNKLTVLPNFHSHLESLGYIEQATFKDQISFSYSSNGNILSLENAFDPQDDSTRFISLHCHLFPQFDICRQMAIRTAVRNRARMQRYPR